VNTTVATTPSSSSSSWRFLSCAPFNRQPKTEADRLRQLQVTDMSDRLLCPPLEVQQNESTANGMTFFAKLSDD